MDTNTIDIPDWVYQAIYDQSNAQLIEPERTNLTEWIAQSDKHNDIYIQIQETIRESKQAKPDFSLHKEAAWERIVAQVETTRPIVQLRKQAIRTVAAVAAIAILGMFVRVIYTASTPNTSIHQLANTTDSVMKHTLPDGSMVELRAGSSVQYAENFETNRTVTLSGSAFFDVAKRNGATFSVMVNNAKVTVLGTEFYLGSMPDSSVSLAVTKGRVAFSNKNVSDSKLCIAGQSALLKQGHKTPEISDSYDPNLMAWKTGVLRFDNTNLETVCEHLSLFYQHQVLVDSTSATLLLSGVYRNLSFDQMCLAIEETFSLESLQHANTKTFTRK